MKKLILIGAGGYAKSVIDSLNYDEYKLIGFIDDYKNDISHLGFPILGKDIDCITTPNDFCYFISIGNNEKRREWFLKLIKRNLKVINIIDKSALLSINAKIGIGCFIGKMAIINSKAVLGDNCIVNTKALVEHGCILGDNINVSTNSVLNGDVKIGNGSFIGSSSVVNGQISIGENVMIGSGSVVIHDIGSCTTAVGVPAKIIKKDGKKL